MQTCRVLRNSLATVRTSPSINSFSLPHTFLARSTSPAVDSDYGRTLANVAQAQVSHEPEQRVSLLLQKTVSLLPRTLSTADGALGPESALFWSNTLERFITELGSGSDQVPLKATITGEWFCDCLDRP